MKWDHQGSLSRARTSQGCWCDSYLCNSPKSPCGPANSLPVTHVTAKIFMLPPNLLPWCHLITRVTRRNLHVPIMLHTLSYVETYQILCWPPLLLWPVLTRFLRIEVIILDLFFAFFIKTKKCDWRWGASSNTILETSWGVRPLKRIGLCCSEVMVIAKRSPFGAIKSSNSSIYVGVD